MKLKQQADLAAFLEAVGQCRGNVHFNTAEGDSLNLQSVLSQYVFAALAGKPELWRSGEIVCDTAADPFAAARFPGITTAPPRRRKAVRGG